MFCGTWCTAFGGLAGHTECVNMLRWPLWALEKVRKMQTCEKDLDPNFALQPELNSHLELYITMASTSCIPFSIFSSVYISSCVFMGVDTWACLCACQRLALTVFLNYSLRCVLKQGLLVNLDVIDLGTLAEQKASGTSCVCLPVTGKIDTHHCAWYFTWMLWVWTQVFMLTWEALYILSHLLNPQSFYIIQKNVKMFIYLLEG